VVGWPMKIPLAHLAALALLAAVTLGALKLVVNAERRRIHEEMLQAEPMKIPKTISHEKLFQRGR
jgi:hypothetical protein